MEDQYVVLLERVIAENVRLREAIEVRDADQQRLLKELSLKIETNQSVAVARSSRKRQRKVSVPQQCRQDFRKMYKALKGSDSFEGFMLDESYTAEANQNATKTILEAVIADHGTADNCPWSMAELKGAAATYFKSLYDASTRAKKGKLAAHNTLCRRQGRMRDKIQRRLSTLKSMPWSTEKKRTIEQAIGRVDITSSDESDLSEDENGQTKLKGFLVKKLPWERTALSNVKKTLDDAYIKGLHRRARFNLLVRRVHSLPSTRCRPIDNEGLEWAVRPPATTPVSSTGPTGATPSTSTGPVGSTPSSLTGPTGATPSPRTATPSLRTGPTGATPSTRTATPSPHTGATPSTSTEPTGATPSSNYSTRPLAPSIRARRSLLTPSSTPGSSSLSKKAKKSRMNTVSKSRSPIY